jgi:hypothetical protein
VTPWLFKNNKNRLSLNQEGKSAFNVLYSLSSPLAFNCGESNNEYEPFPSTIILHNCQMSIANSQFLLAIRTTAFSVKFTP